MNKKYKCAQSCRGVPNACVEVVPGIVDCLQPKARWEIDSNGGFQWSRIEVALHLAPTKHRQLALDLGLSRSLRKPCNLATATVSFCCAKE